MMKYYTEADYTKIASWLRQRGFQVPMPDDLPEIGLVERDVAAGFLVLTDTSCAIIDFLVSNPSANKVRVGRAINEIADGLLGHAKRAGMKRVKCNTRVASVKKLAESRGFKSAGLYECFLLEVDHG